MSKKALKAIAENLKVDGNEPINRHNLYGLVMAILEPEEWDMGVGSYRLRQVDFEGDSTPQIIYLEHKDGALFRFKRED